MLRYTSSPTSLDGYDLDGRTRCPGISRGDGASLSSAENGFGDIAVVLLCEVPGVVDQIVRPQMWLHRSLPATGAMFCRGVRIVVRKFFTVQCCQGAEQQIILDFRLIKPPPSVQPFCDRFRSPIPLLTSCSGGLIEAYDAILDDSDQPDPDPVINELYQSYRGPTDKEVSGCFRQVPGM